MAFNKLDIETIIQTGEGYNAEFKLKVPSKVKELAEEVCAFANAAGGVILLGVDDNNIVQGINIENKKRSAIQDVLHQINPPIHCPFYSNMVEQVGSGINRIKLAIKEANLPKPVFKTSGMFSIVFSRPVEKTREKIREKTREKIVELINANPKIRLIDLSDKTGVSVKGIEYQINKLKKSGVLKRVGSDKSGYWEILKQGVITQKIINAIDENPKISQTELAEKINVSTDSIKYHLNKLKKAGIIKRVGADRGGHWELIKNKQ